MARKKNQETHKLLDDLIGGPLTFGELLHSIREGEEETLAVFAERLGVSRQYLHQLEHGKRCASPEQAARFAELLGYGELGFVKLCLQDLINRAGIKATIDVRAA